MSKQIETKPVIAVKKSIPAKGEKPPPYTIFAINLKKSGVEALKAAMPRASKEVDLKVYVKPKDDTEMLQIPLTKTQIAKILAAQDDGIVSISLSKTQLNHAIKHGSGFFSSFLKPVGKALWGIAKPVIKQAAHTILDEAADQGKTALHSVIGNGRMTKSETGKRRRVKKQGGGVLLSGNPSVGLLL